MSGSHKGIREYRADRYIEIRENRADRYPGIFRDTNKNTFIDKFSLLETSPFILRRVNYPENGSSKPLRNIGSYTTACLHNDTDQNAKSRTEAHYVQSLHSFIPTVNFCLILFEHNCR
jgi:hypothetical protein